MVRVSTGTLSVLGLRKSRTEVRPTTAYLMVGRRCMMDCSFCPQARNSEAQANLLSRVTWPESEPGITAERIASRYRTGDLKRACIQVVKERESRAASREMVKKLRSLSDIPCCLSVDVEDLKELAEVFKWGVDRIGLPLDAASARVYRRCKGGSWHRKWHLLQEAARLYPGRVSTHLIVGLGESEEEMVRTIGALVEMGVRVGLFAFTPVRGTAWEDRPQPPLDSYRRIQAGHFLLAHGHQGLGGFQFENGRLVSFGLKPDKLAHLLGTGEAFQTTGCPDCNRPYYNESPRGPIYNYPRPLTGEEVAEALRVLLVGTRF